MSLFASDGQPLDFEPQDVILAGYTGRDQAQVRRHVAELAAHGVPAPARVPAFYRVTPELIVATDAIGVLGADTSGEAEFLLFRAAGDLYVGLGSDHTDRRLERESVTYAKQVCAKVVAREAWRYADVAPHWDQLVLRAFVGGDRRPYQEGPVAALLAPEDILARAAERAGGIGPGTLVFSGTLPLLGELSCSDSFAAELADERTGRRLSLQYAVDVVEALD
jgi:hypothetical protein